ncbi:hypothetical protein ACUNV4_13315 [Granulosicoccus sp. 3-233]|uniref:hypothetical protein n=1 Tax=Granulosicoccus sp. 3-233 TaxID=3417969 RepID=UPI003D341960
MRTQTSTQADTAMTITQAETAMTIKDAFNDDEWFLLSAMPGMIGAAMSNAAPSGIIGTIREMSAGMRASVHARETHPDSELINALLSKADNWDQARNKMADYRERAQQRVSSANISSREELQAMAIEDCRAATALVGERCSESEAHAYKQWTIDIALAVAKAAKEGSILGIGGERISAAERELLHRIESTLGVQSGILFA